ncbi:receptor-like protein kinase FERONIA [Cornus florida]|uniref:receptor-like protein kinase FERONIA n=1 Tax=Cornus florida TaxID=4283 RepID=UPI00289F4A98|nr:receptor-like protein kinase FERONIA [Cornus florida]
MMSLYQLKIITTIFIIVHHLLPNINGKLPAQYYDIAVSCGSYGKSTALDGRQWIGDISSQEPKRKSTIISRANPYMTSHYDSSVVSFHADHPIPYMTARSSRSHFTYTFQVNPGQKFIRLHFYPHSYPGFERSKSLFTVKSGPYTLLSNFSASLTAESLGVKYFAKEFCVNVGENQLLSLTFSPSDDTTSLDDDVYAFINGIEIISMPDSLYYTPYGDLGARVVGNKLWFLIDKDTALEMVHRLNIGGRCILSIEDLGGMFRMWSEDKNYLLQSGVLPLTTTTLIKYVSTPTHFAPLQVYQTSWSIRSTEQTNQWYSFTWKLPVDFGFRYLVRLHFCELEITESGQKKFAVSINNKMVETNADVIEWSGGNRIAVYKDYVAMIQGDRMKGSRRDLIITLQHKYESKAKTIDTFLKGIEIFKLSNPDNNLAGANPVPTTCAPRSSIPKLRKFVSALGNKNVIATGTILVLTFIVYHLNILESNPSKTNNISSSLLDEELCRHFSLVEMQLATDYFDDANIIGKGGFGNVFKGLIDNGTKTVAIKRLKSGSGQGAREFQAEINVLSKLSHNDHLVSLIGYCDDCPEMILVYEYMDNRSLADHLHKTSRNHNGSNPLPWKRRLNICIGAARGLDFLHTGNGAHHGIIHRDVKSANILLDRSWEAKISDFGLSRMYTTSPSQTHISTMVKGTFGYMDPEYFNTQRLTKKSDVYAFGVVLFEVLGGRPAVDLTLEEEQRSLAQWAKKCLRNKKLDQLIDPSVKEQISPRCLKRFAEIANKCLHDEPNERPAMADVVKTLELIRMELQGMPDANPLYLFPQQAEVPRATQAPASGQAVNPLYLFPHAPWISDATVNR